MSEHLVSALGHKQTFAVQNVMSALHPKADMCSATRDVRFVPIADIANIGLSVSAKIKTLSKIYFTTPQAIRAPPPPKGFGWSE